MTAYVIAQLEVLDPKGYQAYIDRVPATVAAHGGKYLARTPSPTVIEGSGITRVALLEFPSMDAVRAWYASKEYQEILPIRQRHARGTLVVVPGLA